MARCTVERLMRELGITGAVRGRKVITTITDPGAGRAPDLLDRDFVTSAPNRCWVADFTHVATWNGVVYVAFVVDTFSRRIVGWSAATTKETRLVLDALEMALWQRDRDGFPYTQGELIHHSDAGSQYAGVGGPLGLRGAAACCAGGGSGVGLQQPRCPELGLRRPRGIAVRPRARPALQRRRGGCGGRHPPGARPACLTPQQRDHRLRHARQELPNGWTHPDAVSARDLRAEIEAFPARRPALPRG
ncbi:DDE-type integrase/transposase/recombinase [Streptomyces avermitilis]|uniref:DDE-type integrase/transposase/recombinase n=1 Tax=Streptomyces avermitilis TaxID=33903 RepID=UPI0037FF9059